MAPVCPMSNANASQRGHTCWFSTVTTAIANSVTARKAVTGDTSFIGNIKRLSTDTDIGTELITHAGQEKYDEKLHESVTKMLGGDACPLKPKEGHNALKFMKQLLNVLEIENVMISTTAKSNSASLPISTPGCDMVTFDVSHYLEEEALGKIRPSQVTSGICAVQVLAPSTGCAKVIGLLETHVIGKFDKYELRLRNMLVSVKGHVMTYGQCNDSREWWVYDNEFAGRGSPPRKFESFSMQATMDMIFSFPHTFFSPKMGAVAMNPLFLSGPQSATTFMFDIRKIDD